MQIPPPDSEYKLVSISERLPLWLPLVLIMGGVYASLHLTHHYRSIEPTKVVSSLTSPQVTSEKLAATENPISPHFANELPSVQVQEKTAIPTAALQSVCKPLVFLVFKRNHLRPNAENFSAKAGLVKNWLSQHPSLKLVLEGYSDSVGSKQAKLLYSYRRAKIARSMLVEAGMAEDRLLIDAHADVDEPGVAADASRRVTLKAESTGECINQLFDGINK